MIMISFKMDRERDRLLRAFLAVSIRSNNHFRDNYDIPNGQQAQIHGNVRRVISRDDGTNYAIKMVRFEGMQRRGPRQERGFEEAGNTFYYMFQELILHQQYRLGEWNTNIMIHHYTRSWVELPDGVNAGDLNDFIHGNEPMTENLLRQLTGLTLYLVFEPLDITFLSLMERRIADPNMKRNAMLSSLSGVAAGLVELHEKNLVHGDVKPDNILLNVLDDVVVQVKLGDFGLSCYANATKRYHINRNRYFCFAPEELLGVKYDIFCFGGNIFAGLVFLQTNTIVTLQTLKRLKRFALEGDLTKLRFFLNRYLIDQNKYLIELVVQCLQLDVNDRPTAQMISSVLNHDVQFVRAMESVELFGAQNFQFRDNFCVEKIIFPSFGRRVLKEYNRLKLNPQQNWVQSIDYFMQKTNDNDFITVYEDWDVQDKADFVDFIKKYRYM